MKAAWLSFLVCAQIVAGTERPRVIVTSDGEIDDQCSMVRFLLYTNECDVEGIVSSSSQYHAHDKNWAGDDWIDPALEAYAQVHPNLVKHDPRYPTPEYLRERIALGNVKTVGDMEKPTEGSNLIVKVLLDQTDERPVWMQAWGGMNTFARAFRTIEEEHPDRMAEVAAKSRFFFIWEQDRTYQEYIRPVWGKYEIPTIVSDQFEAIAYRWKLAQPEKMHPYFEGPWMREHILEGHGPLCAGYASHENGDFRSEGDSPAFLHTIVTGLRNMESPHWGGWGGRYVRIRENLWLDPVPVNGYSHPPGIWNGSTGWGRNSLRSSSTSTSEQRLVYFKPMWRWTPALQNDFAARADWCVKSVDEANHPPVVTLGHESYLTFKPGEGVQLSALATDPDDDALTYRWWQYEEADTYPSKVAIEKTSATSASFKVPDDANHAEDIHIICEVTDDGSPPLTRYQRVVIEVSDPLTPPSYMTNGAGAVEIPPMVAHFPLNSGDSVRVTDVVGGIEGTLHNADPKVSWEDGALHLDGIDDRIIVEHDSAFDFGNDSFSIAFWMRWPKGLRPAYERILTKGDYDSSLDGETGKRYEIYISSDNLRFNVDDGRRRSQIQVSMDPYRTGEWVHVTAVRDRRNKRLKLYANGVLMPPNNPGNPNNDGTDATGDIANTVGLYIGDASREDNPFQGGLKDLRFFRAALSHNQTAAIASKATLIEKPLPQMKNEKRVIAAKVSEIPPMTAHFAINEGKGDQLNDSVLGVVGALANAREDSWSSSSKGIALRFDGADQRVVVPHSVGVDFADESFSVAFHVRGKKGIRPIQQYLLCKGSGDSESESEAHWELTVQERGLRFLVDDQIKKSSIRVSGGSLYEGDWVHIAAVRDRRAKRLKLFINGELQQSIAEGDDGDDGIDQTGSVANTRDLIIGNSSQRDLAFAGEIADIRFYRSALTPSQIAGVARLRRSAAANPLH